MFCGSKAELWLARSKSSTQPPSILGLRMADLLTLQPNMDIRLHIVAPDDKRERVLREIRRPVFSLLDRGPLYDQCSYISYGSLKSLAEMQHLSHMSDSIIAEYEEYAEV